MSLPPEGGSHGESLFRLKAEAIGTWRDGSQRTMRTPVGVPGGVLTPVSGIVPSW